MVALQILPDSASHRQKRAGLCMPATRQTIELGCLGRVAGTGNWIWISHRTWLNLFLFCIRNYTQVSARYCERALVSHREPQFPLGGFHSLVKVTPGTIL